VKAPNPSDTGQTTDELQTLRLLYRSVVASAQAGVEREAALERRCAELEAALKFIREEVGHEIVEGDFPDFTIAGYIDRALAKPNAAAGEGK
jgi:hypothetical protein